MTQLIETARTSDSRWARMLRVFLPIHDEAEAEESTFNKGLSPVVLLMISPIIGLLFLIFLPFVGFGMLFWLACRGLYGGASRKVEAPEPPAEG